VADERYKKLLDIEPAGEIPTHYELLCIDRAENGKDVIEAKYKEQMRKVQSVRSSKDKGFIEFLKEELRKARLTLTNPKRRQAYDESLVEDAVEDFKTWVQPMMALGTVTKSLYDTFVANGVSMGLSEEQAGKLIHEVAEAHNATLQLEDDVALASSSGMVSDEAAVQTSSFEVDEPMFADEASSAVRGGPPRVGRGETVLPGPSQVPRPPRPQTTLPAPSAEAPKVDRGGFWDEAGGGAAAAEPAPAPPPPPPRKKAWARGGRSSGSAWRKRAGEPARSAGASDREDTQSQRARWRSQNEQSRVGEACRRFNDGAKLASVANRVHEELRLFFPPANGRTSVTYQRNGVTYEKVFDTEHKTYRDALKRFEAALEKLNGLNDPLAKEVRQRASQSIGLVKGYLEEIRQHKLRQLSGLSKAQELRMWQTFVENKRSARLGETIDA
jgi:hypothetical protein